MAHGLKIKGYTISGTKGQLTLLKNKYYGEPAYRKNVDDALEYRDLIDENKNYNASALFEDVRRLQREKL